MSNHYTISTEAFGQHNDFTNTDLEQLARYLQDIDENEYRQKYYSDSYLFDEICSALKGRCNQLVIPIGENDDLRVFIKYE